MKQGFVLTQYFYEQMIQFEKDPAGLKDTIGEMVYSMDVDQQVHRARQIEFDKEADTEVLGRNKPRKRGSGWNWPRTSSRAGTSPVQATMAAAGAGASERHHCIGGRTVRTPGSFLPVRLP